MSDNESEGNEMRTGTTYRPIQPPKRNISRGGFKADPAPAAPRAGAEVFPDAPPAKPAYTPPATPKEARERYWAKWGPELLAAFFGEDILMPETVEDWVNLARATQQLVKAREAASSTLRPSPADCGEVEP